MARPLATDTIVAIATGAGPAGIGIVRISGPAALEIGCRLHRVRHQPSHTLRYAMIREPITGEILDDALVAVFRAPRSFTGEDVVEIQGHGGSVTLKRVFSACLAAGARAARAGEFSERAFTNGRLDLAQAEAVADLIAAGTVAAQRAARRQAAGELSDEVRTAGSLLKGVLARIHASIDFPEEVGEIDAPAVAAGLASAGERLRRLFSGAAYGRRLRDGIRVVLTGRPNVGKSSLLNALAGSDRAIVTPIPGTTRDIVWEDLEIDGIPVRALDTAGIRATTDPIERIGVDRARQAVESADIVVAVLDAESGLEPEDHLMLAGLAERLCIVAINKSDRGDAHTLTTTLRSTLPEGCRIVATTAPRSIGIDALRRAIGAAAGAPGAGADAPLVTSARHEAAILRALKDIEEAERTLAVGLPPELIAVDIHAALQALGEITGETAREDIIAGIFARFCIGK